MLTTFSPVKVAVSELEGRRWENLGPMETAFRGPDPLSFGNRVEFTWFGALLLKVCSRGSGIRVIWDYVKNAKSRAPPRAAEVEPAGSSGDSQVHASLTHSSSDTRQLFVIKAADAPWSRLGNTCPPYRRGPASRLPRVSVHKKQILVKPKDL